jgi:3-deoxy-D-manno-octulosonic-acid transferase
MRRTGSTPEGADVYLLDSVGELASLYREAAVAFVGGSLVPKGGHNPIEAWAAGVPVIVGPHTHNFEEVTRRGAELGILRVAANGEDLFHALGEALSDPKATSERGARAGRFVSENRGAAAATADLVLPLLEAPDRRSAS